MTIPETSQKERMNLLIVDDEPSILSSLQGLFRRQFNISTAESAEGALALIDEHDQYFHVILTDQRMPGMNGCDLLRIIHEKYKNTTSVLITGYSDMNDLIQAVNHGYVFGYVAKPWNPKELKELISKAAESCQRQLQTSQRLDRLEQVVQNQTEILQTSRDLYLEFFKAMRLLIPEEQHRLLEKLQLSKLEAWEILPILIEEIKTCTVSSGHQSDL